MISILLTLRKNSKFFSKWLIAYLKNSDNFFNTELLILANKEDTWNKDWFDFHGLTVYYEDWNCGKNGRHLFFNELAKHAKGEWLWHMCDDHYLLPGFDKYLTEYLNTLNSSMAYCVIPRVENSGSISHILSRGWYETTGRIGYHGNIDSYLNGVIDRLPNEKRVLKLDHPVLYDFTVNEEIMTPKHSEIQLDHSYVFYPFDAPETKREMDKDALALMKAIGGDK